MLGYETRERVVGVGWGGGEVTQAPKHTFSLFSITLWTLNGGPWSVTFAMSSKWYSMTQTHENVWRKVRGEGGGWRRGEGEKRRSGGRGWGVGRREGGRGC